MENKILFNIQQTDPQDTLLDIDIKKTFQ